MAKVEILAPAGSYESFQAAIAAGADAVYLGGSAFGARAYANNFNQEELIRAIHYAHLFGRRVYLTVNTLMRDDELEGLLYDYLNPYYEAGLDAVIVQDMGVFAFVKEHFPKMDIHASTQMTITGGKGARLLKQMGASRVVTAREMTSEQIKEIHDAVEIEIESFVHGALCYSYSGQCLMSSMIGDRSGNRGRCAQPCRMAYTVKESADIKNTENTKKTIYPLSLKDMCTLEVLPEVIDAGVYSLKIEGRMKSSEYVAGVVAMYRKYVDLYLQKGRAGYSVEEEDIRKLMDLYNRGGFSCGYYHNDKGAGMVAMDRPNHQGTRGMRVERVQPASAECVALEQLNPGDVFEIERDFNYTIKESIPLGGRITLRLPKNYKMRQGKILFRTRNNKLLEEIQSAYIGRQPKKELAGELYLESGKSSRLVVIGEYFGKQIQCQTEGAEVQAALKQPLQEEKIRTQMFKTGDTLFCWKEFEIHITGNVFMPMQQLNELRRTALEAMQTAMERAGERENEINEQALQNSFADDNRTNAASGNSKKTERPHLNVMLDTASWSEEMFQTVLQHQQVEGVYLDYLSVTELEKLHTKVQQLQQSGKKAYLALPHMLSMQGRNRLNQDLMEIGNWNIDGLLIRNLEELEVVNELGTVQIPIILDSGLYTFNNRARQQYADALEQKVQLLYDTAPLELNQNELGRLNISHSELIAYGYVPVMIAANCVRKTMGHCDGKSGDITLCDRKNKEFRVQSRCRDCYAITYHESPIYLLDKITGSQAAPFAIRLIFTIENSKMMNEIINEAGKCQYGELVKNPLKDFTRGHFTRGIM